MMKVKYYLLSALLLGGGMTSCSDNDDTRGASEEVAEKASISVELVGNTSGTRAVDVGTTVENSIKNFTVYVFDQSNILEKQLAVTVGSSGDLVKKIEDLTTGPKTIVVLANLGTYPTYTDGVTNYSALATIATKHLDDQNLTAIGANGFVMSGELAKTLVKGDNSAAIPVHRVVAKIKLGTVNVVPADGHDGTFVLENVHIMKAMPYATVTPGTVTSSITPALGYYGGMIDGDNYSTKVAKTYLVDALPADITEIETTPSDIVFYVFPNVDEDNATLLTFEGTYNGEKKYYPFRINYDALNSTGDLIERNTVHTINVTFNKPGNGSENPEVPLDPADLTITVSAADWIVVPTQEVSW